MKICSIASGSSGNCVYVGHGDVHFLVDAGISAKRIEEGLRSIKVEPAGLKGIFITHEHSDHIQGLCVFSKKYSVPVYATEDTIRAMKRVNGFEKLGADLFHSVLPNRIENIEGVDIEPFSISHDAACPVSYTFSCEGHKIAMATDLGCYDEYTVSKLSGAEVLYLEANHDYNMLMVGKYPYQLKQRVAGNRGHLSNETVAELIGELLHCDLKHIILAHMSKENNYQELAYETVRATLLTKWQFEQAPPAIVVANRNCPIDEITI